MGMGLGGIGKLGRLGRPAPYKGGGAPGIVYEAETEALVARFTTPPDVTRKGLINDLIKALKTGGIWAKLDVLYVMAAADAQAARRNWIADAYNLTAVSSPAFTADRGYTGNGSSSYLNTGWKPGVNAVNFAQNSAAIAAWNRVNRAGAAAALYGTENTVANQCNLFLRYTDNNKYARLNDNDVSFADTSTEGLFIVDRSGAAAVNVSQNAMTLASRSASSSSPSTLDMYLLRSNASLPFYDAVDQLAAWSAGASLGASARTDYRAALLTYMQAVGAA